MNTPIQPRRRAGSSARRGLALLAMLGVLACLAAAPRPAAAHAALDSSTPANGAVVATWPTEITATFTEHLDDSYSHLQLFDMRGEQVAGTSLAFSDDGFTMTLTVPAGLPNGTYSVLWRTLSEDDGHTAQNYFSFTVGTDADVAPVTIPGTGDELGGSPQWLKTASRWAALLGIAALMAIWPMWTLVIRPTLGPVWRLGPAITRRMHRYTAIAVAAALLGSVFALVVQAFTLPDGTWLDKLLNTIGQTRYGQLWLARLVLIVATGMALSVCAWWFTKRRPVENVAAWVLTLALPIPFSLIAHAYAQPAGRAFAVTADVLHLLGAGVWVGGLLILATVLFPGLRCVDAEDRRRVLARAIPRFSVLAIIAWAVMGLTGFYAGWLQVGNLAALTGTAYGKALLVKIILLAVILVIATVNLFVISRHLNRRDEGAAIWGTRLRWTVGAEIALVLVVLAAVGQMTSLQPARDVMVERSRQITIPFELPDTSAKLLLAPGITGVNHFRVEVAGADLPADAEALLRLTIPDNQSLGTKEIQLSRVAGNAFEHHGSELSIAGDWKMTLIIREPGQAPLQAETTHAIGTTAPKVDVPGTPWRFEMVGGLSGMALVFIGIGGLVMAVYAGRTPLRKEAGGLGAAALALGVVLLLQARYDPVLAVASGEGAINPNDMAMVSRGEEIYVNQCLSCHGAGLRGDGPAGAGMSPPPADFAAPHTMVHSDGDLVYWIENGKQGTGMPGFGDALSDQDVRDVMAFIKNRQEQLGKTATVPDPAQCTVQPTTIDALTELAGEPATSAQRGAPIQPASDPSVDGATQNQVVATAEEMIACTNAVDTLRRLALFSDDFLRASFPDGVDASFAEMATQEPTPLPEAERIGLRDVQNITTLSDGRIAATVSIDDPANTGTALGDDAQATLIFVNVDGAWRIDEIR
ncbi:MAG TPA: copper resistance protein CopC [Thermomicrobiales bacterium]|nr:copper resistance protein CopC [Thermomicrobiales bacterium]